jgi:predicted dehydrogenase
MKKLKVALAGAGMVSRHHLIAWSRCAEAEIVAIADPVLERAQARAEEFAIPQAFDSIESMLAAGGIEALDVATPLDTHAAVVAEAAERGIPVLCQKPLAATVQEAQAIADTAWRASGSTRTGSAPSAGSRSPPSAPGSCRAATDRRLRSSDSRSWPGWIGSSFSSS